MASFGFWRFDLLSYSHLEGNRFIGGYFIPEGEIKKLANPLIRHFLISVVWIVLISFFIQTIFVGLTDMNFDLLNLKQLIGFTFRVNLFLHCINAIVYYHKQTQSAKLIAEQLEKQNREAQYETLRSQVNPHFLFNTSIPFLHW